jgi:hypothetical protein
MDDGGVARRHKREKARTTERAVCADEDVKGRAGKRRRWSGYYQREI